MPDVLKTPVVRLIVTFLDGGPTPYDHTYTIEDMGPLGSAPEFMRVGHGKDGPPDWLDSPSRSWDRPQDLMIFRGVVKPGREAEARQVLGWN